MAGTKNSDRIIRTLIDQGVTTFYGVQGGACAHIIQSVVDCGGIYRPVLNEQSAGYACHGYFHATGRAAGIIVTTGPGVTNAVSGVAACFFDRVPLVVLTGQVAVTQRRAPALGLRMYGFQEADHIGILRPVVDESIEVGTQEELRRAEDILRDIHGRVLHLDIRDDFQRQIADDAIPALAAPKHAAPQWAPPPTTLKKAIEESRRPLVIIGAGAGTARALLLEAVSALGAKNIPILATWRQSQLLAMGLNVSLFGNHCSGEGNALLRRADLVIAVGAGLLQHQVGKSFEQFAPKARLFIADSAERAVARAETDFGTRCAGWLTDGQAALRHLIVQVEQVKACFWSAESVERKIGLSRSPPARLLAQCIEILKPHLVFSDAGATLSWTYQAAFRSRTPPPVYTCFNLHPMGYAAAGAFGAAHGTTDKTILAVCGDGGFMMNAQDALEVARTPTMKLVIIDNQGYGIIRQTQNDFFGGRHIGSAFGEPGSLPTYHTPSVLRSMGVATAEVYESDASVDLEKAFRFVDHQAVVLHVRTEHGVEGALKPDGLQEDPVLA